MKPRKKPPSAKNRWTTAYAGNHSTEHPIYKIHYLNRHFLTSSLLPSPLLVLMPFKILQYAQSRLDGECCDIGWLIWTKTANNFFSNPHSNTAQEWEGLDDADCRSTVLLKWHVCTLHILFPTSPCIVIDLYFIQTACLSNSNADLPRGIICRASTLKWFILFRLDACQILANHPALHSNETKIPSEIEMIGHSPGAKFFIRSFLFVWFVHSITSGTNYFRLKLQYSRFDFSLLNWNPKTPHSWNFLLWFMFKIPFDTPVFHSISKNYYSELSMHGIDGSQPQIVVLQ